MPIEELPLECLQVIITHLLCDNDTHSLSTLLRVSKHFCAATLPILYSNPFRRELHRTTSKSNETSTSVAKLVNLLLRCAEGDVVTDLLKGLYIQNLEYDQTVTHDIGIDPPSSGINYLRFLQHFYSAEPDLSRSFLFYNHYIYDKVASTDFLDRLGLKSKYFAQELEIEHNPYRPQDVYLQQYLSVDLRVQLTWAICSSVLENIRSLVIPLSDICRYNAVVHRFKNLVHVTFKLDKKLKYGDFFQMNLQESDPRRYADLQRERVQSLEGMIQFVKSHVNLFPHQLQCANCPDNNNWQSNPQKCPELYQAQLQEYLPSLNKPRVLDKNNWAQFLAKDETTDLSQVEIIRAPCSDPNRWFLSLWQKQSKFLERCRNLKELEMVSLGSETFAWAANESYNMSRWNHSRNRSSLSSALKEFLPAPPTQPPHPPVPLEHLLLWSYWTPIQSEINDIFDAFSDTLVTLIVRDVNHPAINTSSPQQLTEGSLSRVELGSFNYGIPRRLRKMIVVLPKQEIALPEHHGASYSSLEYMEIEDGVSRYSCDSVLPDGAPINWRLVKSVWANKSIKLLGRPALCFQPRTLYHTPNLKVLHLGTKLIHGRSYIPPVKDILRYEFESMDQETMRFRDRADGDRLFIEAVARGEFIRPERLGQSGPKRPYWSWDWSLPNLQTLQLTSEFAWRFKFKMLAGCPNLENLVLNMTTVGDNDMVVEPEDRQDGDQSETRQDHPTFEHQRNIQVRDFLLPTDGDETHDLGGFIQNPKLKYLCISGRWFLPDETLEVMLLSVMPNLQTLIECQCLGFTIGGWVRITSQLASLEAASSTRIVKEERLEEVGLAKYGPKEMPRYRVIEEYIDGETRHRFVAVPNGGSDSKRPIYTFNHIGEYIKVS
ncbi:hypothetical protein BGX21_000514 [Mortierella sp. AD011]|nr:hypothetical protein BGX20_000726 [Mortierella sp. AD010]KAF9401810.1 hypothetical protein BGX21_000514 [Mortierella sp. AD011]